MIYSKYYYLSVCCFLIIGISNKNFSCLNNKKSFDYAGKVVQANYISLENKPFIEDKSIMPNEIYFRDRNVIFVLKRLLIYSLNNVELERKDSIIGFVYNRLGTDNFFFYTSFTDTAKMQSIFQMDDSAYFPFGSSWNFKRGFQPSLVENNNFLNLIDTSLNELGNGNSNITNYKLLQGYPKSNSESKIGILVYLMPENMPSYFTFDKNLTEKFGMPVTRVDFLDAGMGPNNEKISWSTRVWLEKNILNIEEHKVFDAWIKNASIHFDSIHDHPNEKYK